MSTNMHTHACTQTKVVMFIIIFTSKAHLKKFKWSMDTEVSQEEGAAMWEAGNGGSQLPDTQA